MYDSKIVFETPAPRKLKVNNSHAHDIVTLSGKSVSLISACPLDEMGKKLPVSVSAFLVEVDKDQDYENISEYNIKKIYVVYPDQIIDMIHPKIEFLEGVKVQEVEKKK